MSYSLDLASLCLSELPARIASKGSWVSTFNFLQNNFLNLNHLLTNTLVRLFFCFSSSSPLRKVKFVCADLKCVSSFISRSLYNFYVKTLRNVDFDFVVKFFNDIQNQVDACQKVFDPYFLYFPPKVQIKIETF